MSRRSLAVLSLVLVTLSVAGCSNPTAPTPSQQQLKPAAARASLCTGGSLDASGRC